MKIPLSLQIAFRFKYKRQKHGIVSLISNISTSSIALGVAITIISLSAINGFEYELNNRILAAVPHGEIEPVVLPFTDWQKKLKCIKQIPGILAAAPYLSFTALIEHDNRLKVIYIKGVDPKLETQLSTLSCYVQNNSWQNFKNGQNQVIIGKGIADIFKIKLGDSLTVLIPNLNQEIMLLQPRRVHFKVAGVFMLNNQLDQNCIIISLLDAQKILQMENDISGIAIKVRNIFSANELVQDAGKAINSYVKVHSWITNYGYMYQDINMIRTIIYLAMILVMSISCFNIISTLVAAVKNKSIDIAILRTLGAKSLLTRSIFIWYGILTGLTGNIIGLIFGITIAKNLTSLVKRLESIFNCHLLSGDIYFIDFMPTKLKWINVISVVIATLFISVIAGWYPAQRANRIDPVLVLKCQ